jgi:DNA-binding FadR family transcriptional regulator
MKCIYNQHCKVVEAVKQKDPDLAAAKMREHLDFVKSRVKELASQDIELN